MKIATIIMCSLSPIVATAQGSVEKAWKAMPDSIIPYINESIRTEMVDMYKVNPETRTKNLLEGKSYIKEFSDNFASIQINATTNMQIMPLSQNDSTYILCVAKTFGTPQAESCISFYSSSWEKLNATFGLPDITEPQKLIGALTQRPDTMSQERFKEISCLLEPSTIIAELSMEDGIPTIKIDITCPLLTNKEREELKAIQKQKSFKWDGRIFK